MTFEFATAGRIQFGRGVFSQVGGLCAEYGRTALIVTGQSERHSLPLERQLAEHHIRSAVLHSDGEPTTVDADRGVEQARIVGADFVIGIGGGSALDLGKAIAALIANGGHALDYLEVVGKGKKIERASLPYIAVPTTSGTGSEATRNAVLESPEHRVKVSLRSHSMLPRVALVDPELCLSVPPEVTAATGFDALSQVIEPFVSNRSNPLTDALCVEAIRSAARSLRRAYEHGGDVAARSDMALTSLIGGIALANAKLGAVHGFAGPLGGMYGGPHGALCAALLPHVMATNVAALRERAPGSEVLHRYDAVARLVTGEARACAEDGVRWISELALELAIPPLARYGAKAQDFGDIADKAAISSSMQGNPIVLTRAELEQVLSRAL